MNKVRLGLVIV